MFFYHSIYLYIENKSDYSTYFYIENESDYSIYLYIENESDYSIYLYIENKFEQLINGGISRQNAAVKILTWGFYGHFYCLNIQTHLLKK